VFRVFRVFRLARYVMAQMTQNELLLALRPFEILGQGLHAADHMLDMRGQVCYCCGMESPERGVTVARTILVHLNIEVPETITTPTLTEDICDELRSVLAVGVTEDDSPFLAESMIAVALAEEV
jgi:hypothetical protein